MNLEASKIHILLLLIALSSPARSGREHEEEVGGKDDNNNNDDDNGRRQHTLEYSNKTFATEIKKRNHFVMFYAPWCGHCQRLGPIWEQLAEMLNEEDGNAIIAKVDCTKEKELCSDHDVTGYPTLKFYKAGESNAGTKFRGTRDLPSLTSFINDQIGSTPKMDVPAIEHGSNALWELTEDTFDERVSEGRHFVKFYAPWCGHCQKLAPTWDDLASSLRNDDSVKISKVDCTQNRGVCSRFDIKGYPTLLWIEDGKKVDKYTGQRTHEELKAYASTMAERSSEDSTTRSGEASDGTTQAVTSLTGHSFERGTQKGLSFVKFFAPWCGHCKRLAPIWEELGKKFLSNAEVKIAKVDCTLDANKQLCNEQEVDGFPTLFLYRDGRKISEYSGSRNMDDLYEFVTNQSESHDEL